MFTVASLTSPTKPELKYDKARLESLLRTKFNDTYVDLFMLELDATGSAQFRVDNVVVTATVVARSNG